ncbi:MAG TPA: hypothetical protein ENK14_00565, partial [Caldithrix sp.]|nr:hypothetical protein [Caldithrix sp.]
MKRILFTVFLLFQIAAGHTAEGVSPDWHLVPSPTRQNLGRLDMISANKGWTFSYDGIILQYNGDTWQIADSLKN